MNTIAHDFRNSVVVHFQSKPSKEMVRLRLIALLVILDILSIQLVFVAVNQMFIGTTMLRGLGFAVGSVIPIFLISAFMVRAYSGPGILRPSASIGGILLALMISATVLGLMIFSLGAGPHISRPGVATTFALAAVMMSAVHYYHARYANKILDGSLYSVIELYDGPLPRTDDDIEVDSNFFFDPVNPSPASFDRLSHIIGRVDRVIVHCSTQRRAAWADVLQGMNVHAEFMAKEWTDIRPLGIGEHNGSRTVVVARGPLNLHDRIIKRSFDIAFSVAALILLTPVMLVAAIAIRLDSPGPVFFVQPRIGRQNQLFSLIKFRSMRQDCCDKAGSQSTSRQDQRVTRIGNFIRRTSIDELPQFINILKGDMSVVGPRPHAVSSTAEDRLFWDIDNRYWHRHACRPGLTGLAQIQGLRGATACVKDLVDRVEADLQYLQSWSFWNDIRIVFQTFKVIVHVNTF
ncbi:sugar transferase [Sphingopyxis sp. USTB-05]|uniref:sugar transferase n=1 Tax=Sphingopyxis sp. USTB-05 TaxID=2830667 RepID=UPI0034A57885